MSFAHESSPQTVLAAGTSAPLLDEDLYPTDPYGSTRELTAPVSEQAPEKGKTFAEEGSAIVSGAFFVSLATLARLALGATDFAYLGRTLLSELPPLEAMLFLKAHTLRTFPAPQILGPRRSRPHRHPWC